MRQRNKHSKPSPLKKDLSEQEMFVLSGILTKELFDKRMEQMKERLSKLPEGRRDYFTRLRRDAEDFCLAYDSLYSHGKDESAKRLREHWKKFMEDEKRENPDLARFIDVFVKTVSHIVD